MLLLKVKISIFGHPNNHLFFSPNRFAIISAWFLNRNCSSHKACAYHDAQSSSLPEQGSIIRFDLIKAQPFSNPSFSLSSLRRCASTSFLALKCNYQRFSTTVSLPPKTAQHHSLPLRCHRANSHWVWFWHSPPRWSYPPWLLQPWLFWFQKTTLK